MNSGAMIYIPSFIKVDSNFQEVIEGARAHKHTHIHTQEGSSHKHTLIFSKYKKWAKNCVSCLGKLFAYKNKIFSKYLTTVRSEVLTAVDMKGPVFWDIWSSGP
jgi:hypothetical protein